jgi:hypothetical protein
MKIVLTSRDLNETGKSMDYIQLRMDHFRDIAGVTPMQLFEIADSVVYITPQKEALVLRDKNGMQGQILSLGNSYPEHDETFLKVLTEE